MNTGPIFSYNFLSKHIIGFTLASHPNIYQITLQIKGLVSELESGKLTSLKEEEVKSRFIQVFFGDILGFNYHGPNEWLLREEKKTDVDGTKPDAALGYFSQSRDDVRAVIEMKNAQVNLDEDQKRGNKRTPVDQAFEYAAKMGGSCKWVVVSNMIEIRFYPSLDRSRCQLFFLKDLVSEDALKQLLFLFHKDRLVRENELSRTDKLYELSKQITISNDTPLHIIDQMYVSLKRFDGLNYIDPNYLATIKPFNILEDHVWHYKDRRLFTLNPLIYHFLVEIELNKGEVVFSDLLQKEVESENVVAAKEKVFEIFTILQRCFIEKITAVRDYQLIAEQNHHVIGFSYRLPLRLDKREGVTRDVRLNHQTTCNCISCSYRKLDFNHVICMLKEAEGKEDNNKMELAFGHYITATNNFKTSYSIYQSITRESKGQPGKGITYFIAKLNSQLLHNLVSDYSLKDRKLILEDIKSIDLDRIIHDDLEFEIDNEVRSYLLKMKEDDLIYKIQDEIEEALDDIRKLYLRKNVRNDQYIGPNYPANLNELYIQLYLYVSRNFIIYDNFKRYRKLALKVFQGFVWSHETSDIGLRTFNSFLLMEAVIHLPSDELKVILLDISELRVDEKSKKDMLTRLNNFFSSYVSDGFFGDPYPNAIINEQLHNHWFKDNFTRIFSNMFIILSKVAILKEQFESCKLPLIRFLQSEDLLAWHDLRELCEFIGTQSHLFEPSEMEKILATAIKGDRYGFNKYTDMIKAIPRVLHEHYPNFLLSNKRLISSAILKATSDDGDHDNFSHLIPLVQACDDECKALLFNAFEQYLLRNFQPEFFEKLVKQTDYDYKSSNYFERYIRYVNTNRIRAYRFGKEEFTDLVFINFALVLYLRNIDFEWEVLHGLKPLNSFESWLTNPYNFDYGNFNARWLVDLKELTVITEKLPRTNIIIEAIERELAESFDPNLAEIKYKYFYL